MKTGSLTRGKLAKVVGCNIETIRFYENIGLMPKPARNESGWRIYQKEDIKVLNFILRMRALGFSLEVTSSLLSLVAKHNFTCKEVHKITTDHIKAVQTKLSDLKTIEGTLIKMAEKCDDGEIPECPIVEALFGRNDLSGNNVISKNTP